MSMEVGLHGLVVACLISLFQLHVVRSQYATDNKTELYIAFITSYGKQYNSSGTVPALELALEEINNSSEVLRDYKLSLFKGRIGDSQVYKEMQRAGRKSILTALPHPNPSLVHRSQTLLRVRGQAAPDYPNRPSP